MNAVFIAIPTGLKNVHASDRQPTHSMLSGVHPGYLGLS